MADLCGCDDQFGIYFPVRTGIQSHHHGSAAAGAVQQSQRHGPTGRFGEISDLPVLAGFLLGIADIRLLLLLDMGTFFVTVVTTLAVRRGIESRVSGGRISFLPEIKEGWKALTGRTGMPALFSWAH